MQEDEPKQEPAEFREFDELYHRFVKCDWHDPVFKEYLAAFEAFMSKHRELYANKYFIAQIDSARYHCKAAGVPCGF